MPFTDRVVEVLHHHAAREASDRDRATILHLLTQMAPVPALGCLARLAGGNRDDVSVRAVLLAHAGERVEREVLDEMMTRPGHNRRALYAAGLTRDPWLDKIVDDDSYPEAVRGAARWWLARDGLVDDLPGAR